MTRIVHAAVLCAAWALLLATAHAQGPETFCAEPEVVQSPLRQLRALSLDLRGRLPSDAEMSAVEAAGGIDPSLVTEWLDSDDFAEQAVRFHRDLLWNNVGATSLLAVNASLQNAGGGLYWRRNLSTMYRGDIVPCEDAPARFGPGGEILTRRVAGANLEGWVEVAPYWDPDSTVRICAFDAQVLETSPAGTDCGSLGAYRDAECGCGPELRWCQLGASHRVVSESMGEALDRLIFSLVREGAPYSALFETRRAFVNGPLVYFYRNHLGVPRGFAFEPSPVDVATLPDLAFTDADTWVEIELPASHAGILTRAGYLMRFQTNRARANRFYDAFLCQPFQPPGGGLPVADEAEQRNPDLQLRAGCKYCHALLEPAASHWGRWTEQGIGYLSPEDFPAERDDCLVCANTGQGCSTECRRFYTTSALSPAEEAFNGQLRAYTFRRDDHVRNVEQGPRLLAASGLVDGRLPRCSAQRAAQWLLGRELDQPGDTEWIDQLGLDFVRSRFDYRALIAAIVTSDRYRRVR